MYGDQKWILITIRKVIESFFSLTIWRLKLCGDQKNILIALGFMTTKTMTFLVDCKLALKHSKWPLT
jgi:hypothetical protein